MHPTALVGPHRPTHCFNEAAGADPADAAQALEEVMEDVALASMRPRGQTPRMH